ncbi:MAG TPA: phosphatidylglycerophosphatase A [Pyrinomonadaceae bacterium]|nr:phosphatidylglycerophosphatase A [Pyrinomonadaceae bacterium]
MKSDIERRKPEGLLDYLSLAITTVGVGYLPLAPGTWGSLVGVAIYLGFSWTDNIWDHHWSPMHSLSSEAAAALSHAFILIVFLLFCLLGVWSAGRSTELFGNTDPHQAVIDEVIGQLIVFLFVPFGISWPLVVTGFLLFRLFDIWKPYPIDSLQNLPAGIGVCADDILAGVYGGVCLAVIYAVSISV